MALGQGLQPFEALLSIGEIERRTRVIRMSKSYPSSLIHLKKIWRLVTRVDFARTYSYVEVEGFFLDLVEKLRRQRVHKRCEVRGAVHREKRCHDFDQDNDSIVDVRAD